MKKTLQGLALMAASILCCCVLAEIAIRLLYPRLSSYNMEMWRYAGGIKERNSNPNLPFMHAPDRKGHYYGADIQTNSFGFRNNREFPKERVAGRKRVMMLGDSFTLGWGVQAESTYSEQLEKLLNANGVPADVINTGVGNYNTVMEVELFREKGLQFNPDLVVLMYFINDAEPTPPVVGGVKAFVFTHSYLIAFLSDRLIRLKPLIDKAYDWKAYYADLYLPDRPGYVASRQALTDLIKLCHERGIKLLIANIPELRELKEYPFPRATESVASLAAEQGVPFLDLRASLVNEDPATLWVTPGDPHANAKANGIMAKALYDAISGSDLLGQVEAPSRAKGKGP